VSARNGGETGAQQSALRDLRRLFLALNSTLVVVAGASCALVHFRYRQHLEASEIAISAFTVLVVLPGIVHLLYHRFRRELQARFAAEAATQRHALQQGTAMRSIMEALLDPVLSIDEDGIVLTANPAVERVFGWRPDELLGNKINALMGDPYRSEHDDYVRQYLRTGEARAIGRIRKVIGRRRSGEDFPCELSVAEVAEGGRRRFVGVLRDISEREAMAARLAQAERLAAIGELAAGIAHEVNNPVNTIVNCAQLIQDGDDDPRLRDDIIHEGMRIASIVRDLLDFSRDRREEAVPVRIEDVVTRTVSLIGRLLDKRGIALELDLPGDLPDVRARFQQLQQVLLNLLLNSRDALLDDPRPRPKAIRIRARPAGAGAGRRLRLSVWDNGPGIEPANLGKVFKPFFTTKSRGGNGLGLAVSREIVDAHGGTLTVESTPGESCEFVVELPLDG
jgi:two-component system sensor kinase FixL